MPEHWNHQLVLYMHGFGQLRPDARVSPPDIRHHLVAQGYAWAASSFSSTSFIPGRAADETAALWDFFARKYGRPDFSYVMGESMGGAATNVAAERFGDRFNGALALCGSADATAAVMGGADFFAAGAFVAGVTQAEFDSTTDIGTLVHQRILPALDDPDAHRRFEDLIIDLTGGPRLFDREGIHVEESTDWGRVELLVSAHLAPKRDTNYRLGPGREVSSEDFNRAAIRLPVNGEALRAFLEDGNSKGQLAMPMIAMHTTGDGEVGINQAQLLQRKVDVAGKRDLLVQRVVRDPSHCGFKSSEQAVAFDDLVMWVEHHHKPDGMDVTVDDLRTLDGRFELLPRPGSPEAEALPGARQRASFQGTLSSDGQPFDAQFLGAVVVRDGRVTPCQYTLRTVDHGRCHITVMADAEASGCGAPGSDVVL